MCKPIHVKPSYYAFIFEDLKIIALKYGYNLVLHGSMNRDLDLIAIAWGEKVLPHLDMIKEFLTYLGVKRVMNFSGKGYIQEAKDFAEKHHGRLNYVINLCRTEKNVVGKEWKDEQYYLDISVLTLGNK